MDTATTPAPVETAPPPPPEAPAAAAAALVLPPEAAKPAEPAKVETKAEPLPADFLADVKDLGLDEVKAKTAHEVFTKRQAAAETARIASEDTAIAAQDAKWLSEAKADKEIGGAAYDANVKLAQRALAKFGGQEVAAVIHAAGLGNHPGLLRAFVRIGKAMAEDAIGSTATPAEGTPSAESGLRAAYPTMFPAAQEK